MQWISWRRRSIHYVDRCLDSAIHHSSLLLHFQRFQECATRIQTHQDNFRFFFWLCFVHLSHSQIKHTLFQAPAAPDLTPTRQQHLHFAVRRRGWLPSALLHCLCLVRGGMGGGGVAVLPIVCKFLPVFCCRAARNVHVGISERCQQTRLLFHHTCTARLRCHAAYLRSTRHSGTRVHKPHSNAN